MNTKRNSEFQPGSFIRYIASLAALAGSLILLAGSLTLLVATFKNLRPLYEIEVVALKTVTAAMTGATEISAGMLLAGWIPIVVCVMAFVIVIAGTVIILYTNFIAWIMGEIARLSALCPTLPRLMQPPCWWQLTAMVALLTALAGLFFIAAAFALINIIVILFV